MGCEVNGALGGYGGRRRLGGGGRCRGYVLKIPDFGTFPIVTHRNDKGGVQPDRD
jgi:hypothetical protein